MKERLDHKLASELFNYDPSTGIIKYKERKLEHFSAAKNPEHAMNVFNSRFSGKEALTTKKDGYKDGSLKINGEIFRFRSHILAWFLYYGEWPKEEIDHKNRKRADNRISNLRDVSRTINNSNLSKRVDNTSGAKGVSWNKEVSKWHVYINLNKIRLFSEFVEDYDLAVMLREELEDKFNFNRV